MALLPLPASLPAPAADAQRLFDQARFDQVIAAGRRELAGLEEQIPAKTNQLPETAEPGSAVYQFFALTLILVNAYAELQLWKSAKEALGKYRVHFPRDPWGFSAGAEVTRRDPDVKDRAAVERAIELLEGEAKRLRGKSSAQPHE